VNGGIAAFLCGGGDKPGCPATAGTVEGTIDAADVIRPGRPGNRPGPVRRARARAARTDVLNVHSNPTFPNGEIRGQIKGHGHEDDDDD
jgi:hypothetical protein